VHVFAQRQVFGGEFDLVAVHDSNSTPWPDREWHPAPDMPPPRRSLTVGIALTAGGAILFASKGLFAKALYRQGVDYQTLTALRALIALPLFGLLAMARGLTLAGKPRRELLLASLAGVLCYALGALLDFRALTMIDVSVERALLFSYPALVVAWTALTRRRWPRLAVVAALLLTYAGILLVVGAYDADVWRQNLAGSLLVLFCASTTSCYFLLGERCIPALGSMGFTIVAMTAAAAAVCLHFLVTHPLGVVTTISLQGWLLLLALAVLCMFLPTLMQAEGIRRIGAVRGSLSGTIGPPAALLLGTAVLGERPGLAQVGGTAMIVAGILIIARRDSRRA
jgi:drug/metabolite transporter (DMT)-like permease